MKGLSDLFLKGIFTALFCSSFIVRSQESIGLGTDFPNADAIMEMVSTDRGLLIPRLTTVQRNTNLGGLGAGDEGMLIYNITDSEFNYWDGTQWVIMPAGQDDDWYKLGTPNGPPNDINDDIFTFGNVGIGLTNPMYAMDIVGALRLEGGASHNIYGGAANSIFVHSNSGISMDLEDDLGNSGYFRVRNNLNQILFRVDHSGLTTIDGDVVLESNGNQLRFEGSSPVDILVNTAATTTSSLDIESQGGIDMVLDREADNSSSEFRVKRNDDGAAAVNTLLAVPEDNSPLVYPWGLNSGETGGIRMRERALSGTNYVGLRAADAIGGNFTLTLPTSAGTNGYVLQTDGTTLLSWVNPATFGAQLWNLEFTNNGATAVTDDMYHTGNVGIGLTSVNTIVTMLHVNATSAIQNYAATFDNTLGKGGIDIDVSGSGTGALTAINIDNNNTGTANKFAMYNAMRGGGSGNATGVRNWFLNTSTYSSFITGVSNEIYNTNNGTHSGTYNYLEGSGTGIKYGSQSVINPAAGGIHYAVYGSALKAGANTWAGYFLGDVYIGTTTGNGYQLPPIDGIATYVMQTDGAGQASWVDPATLASNDNDWTRAGGLMFPSNLTDNVGIGENSPSSRLHVNGGTTPFRVDVSGTEVMRLNNRTLEFLNSGRSVFIGEGAGSVDDLSNNDNVFVGYSAGAANASGADNVAVGYSSLSTNISGINNVAVGSEALSSNTVASGNTAIGYQSMDANINAGSNTAVGYRTLATATGGVNNTAIGYAAMDITSSGDDLVAVGANALGANTTGSWSVAVGSSSLLANINGASNVAVGYQTLRNNTSGSNNVAVGRDALLVNSSGQQNVAIGAQALDANTVGGSHVAIGYGALSTNTTGSSTTAVGFFALNVNTANFNTALGFRALATNTNGSSNTAVGYSALDAQTAGAFGNTGVGDNVLGSNFNGDYNTALGAQALDAITTVSALTAVGYQALSANTSGTLNTAIGYRALALNTTGFGNTAVGYSTMAAQLAGANYNSGFGYNSLVSNTTGDNNIAVGSFALQTLTSGVNNTAIGYQAGSSNNGVGNVFIGYQAGASASSSGELYIDNSSTPTPLIYGNFGSNRIGINCGTPAANLHVGGTLRSTIAINTAALACSDERWKKNIHDIEPGLEQILALRPVNYEWKTEEFSEEQFEEGCQVGFIAQELEMVIPELVYELEDGYKTVNYSKVTPYLVSAVQEQQSMIEQQAATIEQQDKELEGLRAFKKDVQKRLELLEKVMTTAGE